MITFLHQRLQHWLPAKLCTSHNNMFLLSFSGGKDSLCLLKLLMDLSLFYSWKISILYVEHTWRLDSVYTCKHIISMAQKYNINIYLYQIQGTILNEQDARTLRYRVLLSCARCFRYRYIMMGHNQNDYIETIVNNLMRGTTIDGLYSLSAVRNISQVVSILRPLLKIRSTELQWFCRYHSLPLWFDLSNVYNLYQRNRMRNELIPYLKQFFQRDIEKSILEFTTSSKLDHDYIRQTTFKLYYKIHHKNCVAFNYTILCKQHVALQLRVLHLFIRHNLGILMSVQTLSKLYQCLFSSDCKGSGLLYLNYHFRYTGQWICIW